MINVVGSAAKFLFSVSTEDDINKAERHMNELANRMESVTEVLRSNTEKLLSATVIVNKTVDLVKRQMETQKRILQGLKEAIISEEKSNLDIMKFLFERLYDNYMLEHETENVKFVKFSSNPTTFKSTQ